ncbi:MAG: DUF748 domain-containing protein [Desulfobulbaceae bacterium]|nr:MAG: DUF748 domain-containing protein [Desulfobulbaceae bacterium]
MNTNNHDPVGSIPIAGEATATRAKVTGTASSPAPPPAKPRRKVYDYRLIRHHGVTRFLPRLQSRSQLSSRIFWPALLTATILILYLIGSLVFVPLVAPRMMAQILEHKLERSVTIARVKWQPVAGRLVLHNGIIGPRLADPFDRVDPLLSFRTMTFDCSFFALLRGRSLIKTLNIEQGYFHLTRTKEKTYNFALPTKSRLASRLLPSKVEILNNRLDFSDQSHAPPFTGGIADLNGIIRHDHVAGKIEIDLRANGPEETAITLQGVLRPADTPVSLGKPATDLTLHLRQAPIIAFANYLEPLLGVEISGGQLDLRGNLTSDGRKLRIDQQLIISSLRFDQRPDADSDLSLLQALLTNQNDKLRLSLPLVVSLSPAPVPGPDPGSGSDPGPGSGLDYRPSSYLQALASALNKRQVAAAATPFAVLRQELPELEIAEHITFRPGSAELSRSGGRALDQLATALGHRPWLTLQIQGISDPIGDREALQVAQARQIKEQQRQAVAALARKLTAGTGTYPSRPDAPLPELPASAITRPSPINIGQRELLALANQRQQVAYQRLSAALPQGETNRLKLGFPKIAEPANNFNQQQTATVNFQLSHQQPAISF